MTNESSMTVWSWARKSADALAPYVPLQQTLAWILLIAVVIFLFRKQISAVIEAVKSRVEAGSGVEAGPFKLSPDPTRMGDAATEQASAPSAGGSWEQERDGMYKQQRSVFLVHILAPSRSPDQEFDIFIFLVRHKQTGFPDVKHAEFFLGAHWDNKVFREKPNDGVIGLRVAAYGPMLCLCKVTFTDGHQATLSRYIDFEMGQLLRDRTRRSTE